MHVESAASLFPVASRRVLRAGASRQARLALQLILCIKTALVRTERFVGYRHRQSASSRRSHVLPGTDCRIFAVAVSDCTLKTQHRKVTAQHAVACVRAAPELAASFSCFRYLVFRFECSTVGLTIVSPCLF